MPSFNPLLGTPQLGLLAVRPSELWFSPVNKGAQELLTQHSED